MSFFKGAFKGQSNGQVIAEWNNAGTKARQAHQEGRRDRNAEAREAAAEKEMRGRWREENANPEASLAISRWSRKR